jgi:hypothetical protein
MNVPMAMAMSVAMMPGRAIMIMDIFFCRYIVGQRKNHRTKLFRKSAIET